MNTRILATEYDYYAPATMEEVLKFLRKNEHVKILAGGTDLILELKTKEKTDLEFMLDIKRVQELNKIIFDDQEKLLHIGPTASLSQIEKNDMVKKYYPALAETISLMASVSVRNMGTMAGNICNASPVADSIAPAICYNASLTLASYDSKRTMPIHEFFVAPGVSVMKKDEMLIDISIPLPKPDTGAMFQKKSRVKPDVSKVSTCALIERDGQNVKLCRIAMSAVGPTPDFLEETGNSMAGKKMSGQLITDTVAMAMAAIQPSKDRRLPRSRWSTTDYRLHVAEIMITDALQGAWIRAGGEL